MRLPSGDRAASQGLVTTRTPLYVSRATDVRRLDPLGGTRLQIDRCGKMEPLPSLRSILERICDRYALGRCGCTTTWRQRLSTACPCQESTTLCWPSGRSSTACRMAV